MAMISALWTIVSRIVLDTLEALKLTYPKPCEKRRLELLAMREQLAD